MNANQLLDYLSENRYTELPKSYEEPYLRTVKTDDGVAIHQIIANVFYSPSSGDFILGNNALSAGKEFPENLSGFHKVNDFALLYKAYVHFDRKGMLDESTRLDICLVLIRMFYNEYPGTPVSNNKKYKKDQDALLGIVVELQNFGDELLSPVIKHNILCFVYLLLSIIDKRRCCKICETASIMAGNVCEEEAEYGLHKKTSPMMLDPGLVNLFFNYSKINLPNCSGRWKLGPSHSIGFHDMKCGVGSSSPHL